VADVSPGIFARQPMPLSVYVCQYTFVSQCVVCGFRRQRYSSTIRWKIGPVAMHDTNDKRLPTTPSKMQRLTEARVDSKIPRGSVTLTHAPVVQHKLPPTSHAGSNCYSCEDRPQESEVHQEAVLKTSDDCFSYVSHMADDIAKMSRIGKKSWDLKYFSAVSKGPFACFLFFRSTLRLAGHLQKARATVALCQRAGEKTHQPTTMANTVARTATQQVTARGEPLRANHDDDSIGSNCKNAVTNASAVAGTPKLDFLCTVLEFDGHFNKTNSPVTTIDWKTIENFKSSVDDRLASPSCSSAMASRDDDSSSSCENRGDVNVKRCISPSTHPMPSKPCLFEPSLGRPLPRPPMLPSSLYSTDKKRKLEEYENDGNSNAISAHQHPNTFHCKAKVYLPSGKSLDIVAPTIVPEKKRGVVTYQRCTDLRMDPLSPPPFTLPKRPVGFLPR
jgi:hypothetical protein